MAYVNPDILEEDWDNFTGWNDKDTNGGVSEIDPAGQYHADFSGATGNADAERDKDIGAIGSDDYYIEMRFIGDAWDGFGDSNQYGIDVRIQAATRQIIFIIANDMLGNNDGIATYSGGYAMRVTKTWDNNWHNVVFKVHTSQTKCDIWIDKDPRTEEADYTDVPCDYNPGADDGLVAIIPRGSVAIKGEYHIDHLYIGSELLPAPPSGKIQSFIM